MLKGIYDYLYFHIGCHWYSIAKCLKYMPDKMYLQNFFAHCMGYYMDFDNPITFNEKLQWLKLYDRNPLYTRLVDKYNVKSWVANIIGGEHIIPTIAVYDNFENIVWEDLPTQFVAKCTHDSGSVVVCPDKRYFSLQDLEVLKRGMEHNYYLLGREWPYKNVPHRILIEKYINDPSGDLKDYKFFCFNGSVEFFKIDFDRQKNHHANYYDVNGNILPFGEVVCHPCFEKTLEIPSNLSNMVEYAEKISREINSPFVRIDFYDVAGSIFFGEITFYPSGGHGKFTLQDVDRTLGDMIELP